MISPKSTNANFIVVGLTRPGLEPRSTAIKTIMLTIKPVMLDK